MAADGRIASDPAGAAQRRPADDPLAAVMAALARTAPPSSDYDLNPGFVVPQRQVLRDAAVLVPLLPGPQGTEVILTRRSSRLKHHPGQIALPGGKVDRGDPGPVAAALREAWEEIRLPAASVEVLGTLAVHRTVTGFSITPVVARVASGFVPAPDAAEVAEAFHVPLAHLMDLEGYRVETRDWLGQPRHYYAVPYGPYYIWGATARILHGLAARMAA